MASSQRFNFIERNLRGTSKGQGPCAHEMPLSPLEISEIARKKREIDPDGQIAHQLAIKMSEKTK